MPDNKPALCFIGFAKPDKPSPPACAKPVWRGCQPGIFCFHNATVRGSPAQAGETIGVLCAPSAAEVARGADTTISAVTAASSVEAAQSVKAHVAG